MALDFGGELYGLSVGGPTGRSRQHLEAHAAALIEAKQHILATWRKSETS